MTYIFIIFFYFIYGVARFYCAIAHLVVASSRDATLCRTLPAIGVH